MQAAIEQGVVINLESENEARRAITLAESIGKKPHLAVRVNPDFSIKGAGMRMGGGALPFGVDASRVPELVRFLRHAGADWHGFHIFTGSQVLQTEALMAAQNETMALAARLADEIGHAPSHLNLGGGFGIPYFTGDMPINLPALGDHMAGLLNNRKDIIANAQCKIELGRFLVGQAGIYVAKIMDIKTSHGEKFVILNGGLHHQLAASGNFGTVIKRNYPVACVEKFGDEPEEIITICGCLCTPIDRLAHHVALPALDVGEHIVIFCAGAYGATASPADFLGHGAAQEYLV